MVRLTLLMAVIAFSIFTLPGNAQTIQEQSNLESAFKSLSDAERRSTQRYLFEANLYHSQVDGLWGSGTKNALFVVFNALQVGGLSPSLETHSAARNFVGFVSTGSAQAYIFGEGQECDGCEQQGEGPAVQNTANNGLPRWLMGSLPRTATIADWLNASYAVRRATAGEYAATFIRSDVRLTRMVRNGELKVLAERVVSCMNEMIQFGIETGQKRQNSRLYDISGGCAFIVF